MANVGTLSIKFTGDASQLESVFTKISVRANVISDAITSGFKAAAGAVGNFVKGSIAAYDQEAKAQASLLTALKGREDVSERLIQQASDLQKLTLFGDETTVQAQAFLAQMGLAEDAITRVIPLVQDFATAQKIDLDSAAKLVAKSIGSSTNALSRYGIEIKGAVGSNERLESAVNALSTAFAGQAQAAAEAGSGPLIQFQNALSDLQELVGKALTPALGEAAKILREFVERINEAAGGEGLLKIQAALLTVVRSVNLYTEALRNSLGTIVALYQGTAAFGELIKGNFKASAVLAAEAVKELSKPFQNIINLKDNIKSVIETYNTALDELRKKSTEAGTAIKDQGDKTAGTGKQTRAATDDLLKFITAQEQATLKLVEAARVRDEINKKLADANIAPTVSALLDPKAARPDFVSLRDFDTTASLSPDAPEIDEQTLAIERQAEAQMKLRNNMAAAANVASQYGQSLQKAYASGATGAKAFAIAAVDAAKEVIAAQIREGVITAATKALAKAKVPFPFNVLLAGIAAGAAEALFRTLVSKIQIPAFGDGGVVFGPTLALIGEKGPEAVVPLRGNQGGQSGINIRGVQYGTDTYWQNANVGIVGRLIYGK